MLLLFCLRCLCCLLFSVYQWLSGAGCGCMIENVTIKWVTGNSKLKNNGETRIDGFRKSSLAFEKEYAIITLGNRVFFFVIIEWMLNYCKNTYIIKEKQTLGLFLRVFKVVWVYLKTWDCNYTFVSEIMPTLHVCKHSTNWIMKINFK